MLPRPPLAPPPPLVTTTTKPGMCWKIGVHKIRRHHRLNTRTVQLSAVGCPAVISLSWLFSPRRGGGEGNHGGSWGTAMGNVTTTDRAAFETPGVPLPGDLTERTPLFCPSSTGRPGRPGCRCYFPASSRLPGMHAGCRVVLAETETKVYIQQLCPLFASKF